MEMGRSKHTIDGAIAIDRVYDAPALVGTTIYDKTKAVACRTMCKMPMFFMKNLI